MSTSIVAPVLDSSLFVSDVGPRKKESTLHLMAARAHASGAVREAALLHEALLARERLGASAIGKGLAVPHLRSITVIEPRLVVARSTRGLDWGDGGEPVHAVLMAFSPAELTVAAHQDAVERLLM